MVWINYIHQNEGTGAAFGGSRCACPKCRAERILKAAQDAEVKRIMEEEARQITAPAAGPWRYDVENVPKNGERFLGVFMGEYDLPYIAVVNWHPGYEWFESKWAAGLKPLLAWAEINQPEVEKCQKYRSVRGVAMTGRLQDLNPGIL